ncbi:MAG: hypothetical protein ACRDHF_04670 [Tepidiformaceae bacterium]
MTVGMNRIFLDCAHVRLLYLTIGLAAAAIAIAALGRELGDKRVTEASAAPGEATLTPRAGVPAQSVHNPDPGPEAITDAAETIPSMVAIPDYAMAAILRDASPYPGQLAAVEDGVVTLDELNSAFAVAQQCTEEIATSLPGVVVRPAVVDVGGYPAFGGFSAPSRDLLMAASAMHKECVFTHFDAVSAGWGAGIADGRFRAIWGATASCMEAAGVASLENATWQQLREASVASTGDLSLFDTCDREAKLKLGY